MKKYLSIIILLSLSLFLLSCESKEADYVEIIKNENYIVYQNLPNNLKEDINIDSFKNKGESSILNSLGYPLYIIDYKSNSLSDFDSRILIYSYDRDTSKTLLNLKNDEMTDGYTDTIDSMDSSMAEDILEQFNK